MVKEGPLLHMGLWLTRAGGSLLTLDSDDGVFLSERFQGTEEGDQRGDAARGYDLRTMGNISLYSAIWGREGKKEKGKRNRRLGVHLITSFAGVLVGGV